MRTTVWLMRRAAGCPRPVRLMPQGAVCPLLVVLMVGESRPVAPVTGQKAGVSAFLRPRWCRPRRVSHRPHRRLEATARCYRSEGRTSEPDVPNNRLKPRFVEKQNRTQSGTKQNPADDTKLARRAPGARRDYCVGIT